MYQLYLYSAMKTPQQIAQWLKAQKFYGKFVTNYKRQAQCRPDIDVYLKRISPDSIISCAFVWHDTQEGNVYWYSINNKYKKWLNN